MDFILLIQVVLAVLITFSILLQNKASGLSAALGGGGGTTYVQRRGAERVLHVGTITLSILFFLLTLADWYV